MEERAEYVVGNEQDSAKRETETRHPFRRSFKSQGEANDAARRVLRRLLNELDERLNVVYMDSEIQMRPEDDETITQSRSPYLGETWTFSFGLKEEA